jgi:NADPH-dependent glutamate synthase beta subunit-like oxidoreductase
MPRGGAAHAVAVIGGATAGAEVAERLAARGVRVAVFEQNPRPYGKIEDGLPRWHAELRRKEYAAIGAKLAHPNVAFVPNTAVGRDVEFADLARSGGWSAVVLACGAWRDRPLPIEGADAFVGRGLIYQNPFIIGFNHAQEAAFEGPRFEAEDDALVIGGGLASIDVVKVLALETTRAVLARRGLEVPMLQLEVKGIPRTLAAHGLRFEELGLRGCTLFYRRRAEDMPVVEAPEGAGAERLAKVAGGRRKLLEKAMEKYCFRFEPLAAPDGLLVEGDRLAGLRFRRTRMEAGRPVATEETFERRGSCVISSIGSIPAPLPGVPMKGELYDFRDWELGRLAGYPTVFAAGNVVTGKGNIVASRKHAAMVSEFVAEAYLGLRDGHAGEEAVTNGAVLEARELAARVAEHLDGSPPLPAERIEALFGRVRERQRAVGHDGDFASWIRRVTPPDLE